MGLLIGGFCAWTRRAAANRAGVSSAACSADALCGRHSVCHLCPLRSEAHKGDVFALGIVEGNTDDLAGIPGALKEGAQSGVLAAIDGFAFWLHGNCMAAMFRGSWRAAESVMVPGRWP